MSREIRELRRAAGMLLARAPDLRLEELEDRRSAQGKRYALREVILAVLVGLLAGCKSYKEVEALVNVRMNRAMRRRLGLKLGITDTTMRNVFVRLHPYEVRRALHHLVRAAARRKALFPREGLPFGVVAMDGKETSIPAWDHHYAQQTVTADHQKAYGLVRTVNACLISAAAKPLIDAFPLPAETNEMGIFPHAFDSLVRHMGHLFQLVTYDAGVPSEDNCRHVVEAGKDFNFRIKNENWHVYKEAERRLGKRPVERALHTTEDVECKGVRGAAKPKSTFRSVFTCEAPALPFVWDSVKTLVRVHVRTIEDGRVVHEEDKFYISSLTPKSLTPEQWLYVTRGHWAVENNGHWTLDAVFREDERPWIVADPRGAVVTMLLRRIAYTLLALFRAVIRRSEDNPALSWSDLMTWVLDTLLIATDEVLAGLRPRHKKAIAFS